MPRYDYRCSLCGHQFELRQSFDSPTVMDCLKCGAAANRKFHAPPVIFKGSGWYVNDYGKGRGNNGTGGGDGEKAESKDGERAKSEGGAASESAKSGASEPAAATAGKDG